MAPNRATPAPSRCPSGSPKPKTSYSQYTRRTRIMTTKGAALLGIFLVLIAFSGCTSTMEVQIENTDGRVRYYDAFSQDGGQSEKWMCTQSKVARLSAEYHCQARLWR